MTSPVTTLGTIVSRSSAEPTARITRATISDVPTAYMGASALVSSSRTACADEDVEGFEALT